jgi:threonylcarbamoyladenosine tRNA methylthiotransferase MtaB
MKKVCLINLGCKVNQYEIDGILNQLKDDYIVTTELEAADFYIVNTCAVTAEAERKSRQFLSKIEKINPNAKIFVCGCASQHNPEQFTKRNGVVYVIGNSGKGKIAENVKNFENREEKNINFVCPISKEYEDDLMATNVRTRGYIKIQDGCNNYCSYCLIPYVRGFSRSRPLKSIVEEANILSKNCEELVITGINISDYKIDGKLALGEVLRTLKGIKSRIRLGSIEMNIITDDFLQIAKEMPNFCPQFHLSLQSGSDKVLKDMNRHYTTEQYYQKVCLVRKYFPFASITTDIIVGYPTETEECFDETLEFVKKVRFSHVHFFAYSQRPGTRASKLPQISGDIIKLREKRLKTVVETLEMEYVSQFIGAPLETLIEEKKEGYLQGYSRNYIRVYTQEPAFCGKIVTLIGKKLFKDGILC